MNPQADVPIEKITDDVDLLAGPNDRKVQLREEFGAVQMVCREAVPVHWPGREDVEYKNDHELQGRASEAAFPTPTFLMRLT